MFTVYITCPIQRSHKATKVSIIMLVYLLYFCVSVSMYMFFWTRHQSLLIVSCICILGRRPLITKINQYNTSLNLVFKAIRCLSFQFLDHWLSSACVLGGNISSNITNMLKLVSVNRSYHSYVSTTGIGCCRYEELVGSLIQVNIGKLEGAP